MKYYNKCGPCDLLSKNQLVCAFLKLLYMTSSLSRDKNQWSLDLSALSNKQAWNNSDRNQREQNN